VSAGQSRLSSLAETCISIAIGFLVSLGINAVVMPAFGHHISLADNLGMTAIFTVASVARGYLVRRWFNRITTAPKGTA
jgi:membrane protein implicated in regulation of membrane protease activity